MGTKKEKPRRGHAGAPEDITIAAKRCDSLRSSNGSKDRAATLAALWRSLAGTREPALRERLAAAIARLEARRS